MSLSGARMTNTPCGLTDPSAVPAHAVRAMPLAIVSGAALPLRGHLLVVCNNIDPSSNVRDTPT